MSSRLRPRFYFGFSCPILGVRPVLIVASTLAIVAASSASLADVIYLKNGRKIVAVVTKEDSKQVIYERAGGEITIPRSLVERIEKSTLTPEEAAPAGEPAPSSRPREIPLPPPTSGAEAGSAADPLVVKGGAVDEAYLIHLDDELLRNSSPENQRRLKQAYVEAAIFHTRQGQPDLAIQKYRQALKLLEDDLPLTIGLGYLLVTERHFLEAVGLLLPAADRYPRAPDIPMLLGSAYYGQENLDQAIAEWNKALAIRDNPRIREAIATAEKERSLAGSFQELRSEHFLLRYEGNESETLSGEVLKTLEAIFHDLERDLDYYPSEPIVVILYPNQAFRDITRSPSWAGAINDGKVRLPVSGLTTVTPSLARVLKHELTHSFVRQVTMGRVPTWFNEGLAQLEEGATTAEFGSQLARILRSAPAYSALESSFMAMPPEVVKLAYPKSLAALEFIRETYGLAEIRRLLKAFPARSNIDSLLQNELRLSYPGLDESVAAYVEKRYGSP